MKKMGYPEKSKMLKFAGLTRISIHEDDMPEAFEKPSHILHLQYTEASHLLLSQGRAAAPPPDQLFQKKKNILGRK